MSAAQKLAEMHCVACRPDSPKVEPEALEAFLRDYPNWEVIEREGGIPQLERVYKFKNYNQAQAFTNRVAALANVEDHHPALLLEWGKVTVTWWTHAIQGLHYNDLVMAAKTELAYRHS
jgi:4a-hydroxytetrahydrobiopterin dehydratase